MTTPDVNRPWIERNGPRTALCAAAVLTFLGELGLAKMAGYHWTVAICFPIAIDVYAFTAFHMDRKLDVAISLLLMGVANVASHLIELGLIPMTGTTGIVLMVLVVLIPVVIAWRAHAISKPAKVVPETVIVEEVKAVTVQPKGRRAEPKVKRTKAETALLVRSFMCDNPNSSQAAAARALNISEKWVSECLKLNPIGATA